jgi:hypothetical protein
MLAPHENGAFAFQGAARAKIWASRAIAARAGAPEPGIVSACLTMR